LLRGKLSSHLLHCDKVTSSHSNTCQSRGKYKLRTWNSQYCFHHYSHNRLIPSLHFYNITNFVPHKFSMLASLLILGLAALAYAIPTTELVQRDSPDLSQVFLQKVSWDGTGCPKESNNVGNYTSPDKQTLVFESHKFTRPTEFPMITNTLRYFQTHPRIRQFRRVDRSKCRTIRMAQKLPIEHFDSLSPRLSVQYSRHNIPRICRHRFWCHRYARSLILLFRW
jgi:hypothetical protein